MGGGVEQGNEDASGGGLMFGNFAPVNWSLSQLEEQVRFGTTSIGALGGGPYRRGKGPG